ncbi:MAG: protein kinase [Acidobacteria bacterium]|nr:protein kinase [Acidobacteriota bacterium]
MGESLKSGVSLGPYRIVAPLGAGGMGEVYRATDTKLDRDVAVKVLPESLAADPERLARFEREAKVLASLNHPNIAAIYGLEGIGSTSALVMELVEGETLAERLERGRIPLDETLAIARQVAEALEAAHEKGIVHRDLKPANVKITPEGKVKVLDFGLAKAISPIAGSSGSATEVANSPTITRHATAMGAILGTAAYMSPEQAKGKTVDKRADVWAFGAVLFEMLTGKKLFAGDSVAETLAAVLRADPDWRELPPALPKSARDLVRRCLEREPRRRIHDIADARIVLDELADGRALEAPESAAPPAAPARRLVAWGVPLLVGVLGTLTVAAALWQLRSPAAGAGAASAASPRVSYRQLTFSAGGEFAPSLAPDGESFAFVREVDGQADIFLQRVDGQKAINLTEGCRENDDEPAFSPDGRSIAYHSECGGGGIFVMGATGESARKVTGTGHNAAWSPDGRELAIADEQLHLPFGRGTTSKLWAVRVENGERRLLSEQDAVQPSWSPDGRRVAFWGLKGTSSQRDIWTVAADGSQAAPGAAVPVMDDPAVDWSPVWSADGRALLFSSTRGGTMNTWRIPIDPASGRPAGEPIALTAPSSWVGFLSSSRDGRRLAFVDRNVRTAVFVAPFDPVRGELAGPARRIPLGTIEVYEAIDLAPDGESVLFDNAGLPQHLYLARPDGTLLQLTDGPHRDRQGMFSPDGQWIVFQSNRWGSELALIHPDGSGMRELVTGGTTGWYPAWSPDGRRLLSSDFESAYVLDMADGAAKGPLERLPPPDKELDFWASSWSPDGQRIAGEVSRANNPVGIAVYSLADRSFRRLTAAPGARRPYFLPDGKRLLWARSEGVEIHDLESGRARLLMAAAPGYDIAWATLSRDGRHLAWHEQADESDLWLALFE